MEDFLALFQSPPVVVFSGHMIDRPERPIPRFPQGAVSQVKREIKEKLRAIGARMGFASGACGADLLFHEAMLEIGGETNVVIPFDRDQFVAESVAIGGHADGWKRKFAAVTNRAKSLITVSLQKTDFGSVYYEYANIVLNGLARNRAAHLDTELVALTVWNGQSGDGPGGTAGMHQYWKEVMGIDRILVIDPTRFTRGGGVSRTAIRRALPEKSVVSAVRSSEASPVGAESIKAILFADVVKFSSLRAGQIPDFVRNFLGAIADLIARAPFKPETRNTWGDGLYFVFDTVEHAGLFALDLSDLVTGTDWAAKGLNGETSIRIALHAGPVLCCRDPILEVDNYTGYHVNMAARLEPITPPGSVYATLQFAALASFHGVAGFVCDYAGQIPFPKGFGAYPIYHVCRG